MKTSLAPGSRVVTDYLDRAGLTPYLEKLGFALVGYGCTTCIGNSGPLIDEVARGRRRGRPQRGRRCSRGNRNFEGRVHPQVRASYLASPPLVRGVRAGGAGRPGSHDRTARRGQRRPGLPARPLADAPTRCATRWRRRSPSRNSSTTSTNGSGSGTSTGRRLPTPSGPVYDWDPAVDLRAGAAVLRRPRTARPSPTSRARACWSRSATRSRRITSRRPARSRRTRRPGAYLREHGVEPVDFNSYGSRRGQPRGDDARHVREHPPAQRDGARHGGLVHDAPAHRRGHQHLRGGDRGTGTTGVPSGRACGQGVRQRVEPRLGGEGTEPAGRAVRAGGELRAHPPVEPGGHGRRCRCSTRTGESAASLGLDGTETFASAASAAGSRRASTCQVEVVAPDGAATSFSATVRIDGAAEVEYYARAASCGWCSARCWAPDEHRKPTGPIASRAPPRVDRSSRCDQVQTSVDPAPNPTRCQILPRPQVAPCVREGSAPTSTSA